MKSGLCLIAFAAFNILLVRAIFAWIDRWLAQRRTREILGAVFMVGLALTARFFLPRSEAEISLRYAALLRLRGVRDVECVATAAVRARGPIEIRDVASVATSFPNFVASAREVGLQIERCPASAS